MKRCPKYIAEGESVGARCRILCMSKITNSNIYKGQVDNINRLNRNCGKPENDLSQGDSHSNQLLSCEKEAVALLNLKQKIWVLYEICLFLSGRNKYFF